MGKLKRGMNSWIERKDSVLCWNYDSHRYQGEQSLRILARDLEGPTPSLWGELFTSKEKLYGK